MFSGAAAFSAARLAQPWKTSIRSQVVVERPAVPDERRAVALANDEARVEAWGDVRFRHRHAVDHLPRRGLGCPQRRGAAVRDARRDDQRVVPVEPRRRCPLAHCQPVVHRPQREAQRQDDMPAPVGLWVELGVGVLPGPAVRVLRVEGGALLVGEVGREGREVVRCVGISPFAAQPADGVALKVVGAGAGALVGVGDRASPFEAPLARRADGSVHAARSRGGCRDDAGPGRIEGVRDLHHEGNVLIAVPAAGEGEILCAEDPALRVGGGRGDQRPVEPAVAAAIGDVDQGAVVVVDRQGAKLFRRRRGRQRRRRSGEAGRAEAAGQQVAAAGGVVDGDQDFAMDEVRSVGAGGGPACRRQTQHRGRAEPRLQCVPEDHIPPSLVVRTRRTPLDFSTADSRSAGFRMSDSYH